MIQERMRGKKRGKSEENRDTKVGRVIAKPREMRRNIWILICLLIATITCLLPARADDQEPGRRWGMIGRPPLPDDVRIVPGYTTADGYQTVRLMFGNEVGPGERPLGYLEALLTIKANLKADNTGVHINVVGDFVPLKEQEPNGFAAFDWGLRRNTEFTLRDLVEKIRFNINGEPQTSTATGGLTASYPYTPDYEDGSLTAELDLEFFGGQRTLVFPLSQDSTPRFTLQNLRVQGLFTQSASQTPPPFAPSSEVDHDGHFTVHLPADWLSQGEQANTVNLYLYERTSEGLKSVDQRRFSMIRPHGQNSWASLHIDQIFSGFWWRQNGPYMIRVEIRESGSEGTPIHQYQSPDFDGNDLLAALSQRLDALSLQLFGMPFREWKEIWDRDQEEAKHYLWKGLYDEGHAFRASVEVINLSDETLKLPLIVVLEGKFASGKTVNYASQKVFLGMGEVEGADLVVPAGSVQKVDFGDFQLGSNESAQLRLFDDLLGFDVRVVPYQVGNRGKQLLSVEVLSFMGSDDPRIALARAMRILGNPTPDDPASYTAALDAVFAAEALGPALMEDYRQAKGFHEQFYDGFVRLVNQLDQRLAEFSGTGLEKLELAMSRHFAEGRHIVFGRPEELPSMSARGSRPSILTEEFTLNNSTWRTSWSAFGALLNPELSFAIDPNSLLAGTPPAEGEEIPQTRSTALLAAGLDRWRWSNEVASTDEYRLARDLYHNPNIGGVYAELIGPDGGFNSPRVANKIRLREFEQVKGQIHEEISFDRIARAELDELKRGPQGFDGELIAIRGDQVTDNSGQELTDGVILGIKDGEIRLLRISEMKAGEGAAKGVGEQIINDRRRLLEGGLKLKDLTPEQQRALGLSRGEAEFAPGQLGIDFSDPRLFMVVTPKEVPITPALGAFNQADAASLPRNEREAMRQALINARQTDYDAKELTTITELAFRRAGVDAHPWNARDLTYGQFKDLTTRNLPAGRTVPESDLKDHYRNGRRYDPSQERWVSAFEEWEKPVMSPDEVMALWEANVRRGDREKARQQALQGKRFNPKTKRFSDPNAKGTKLYVVDPTLPRALLPDEDFMLWWEKNKPPRTRLTDEQVLQRRRQGKVYSPETKQFREPTRAVRNLVRQLEAGLLSQQLARVNHARATRAEVRADIATEVIDRAAAALFEVGRLRSEKLLVTTKTDRNLQQTRVIVRLQAGGGEPIGDLPPHVQRTLLKNWYRHAGHFWQAGSLPRWLQDRP